MNDVDIKLLSNCLCHGDPPCFITSELNEGNPLVKEGIFQIAGPARRWKCPSCEQMCDYEDGFVFCEECGTFEIDRRIAAAYLFNETRLVEVLSRMLGASGATRRGEHFYRIGSIRGRTTYYAQKISSATYNEVYGDKESIIISGATHYTVNPEWGNRVIPLYEVLRIDGQQLCVNAEVLDRVLPNIKTKEAKSSLSGLCERVGPWICLLGELLHNAKRDKKALKRPPTVRACLKWFEEHGVKTTKSTVSRDIKLLKSGSEKFYSIDFLTLWNGLTDIRFILAYDEKKTTEILLEIGFSTTAVSRQVDAVNKERNNRGKRTKWSSRHKVIEEKDDDD